MNRYRRETGWSPADFDEIHVPTQRELAALYLACASARRKAVIYRRSFGLPEVPHQISMARDTLAVAAKWRQRANTIRRLP